MTNPAPYYFETKVITVINGNRVEPYSPGFVRVLDVAKYGDVPADVFNSIVRPVTDFPGNAEIEAYVLESKKAWDEFSAELGKRHRNARFGLKTS